MTIKHARWEDAGGWPRLTVEFDDGRRAFTTPDACKPAVLAQNVVLLLPFDGEDWPSVLPPVAVVNEQGRILKVEGGFVEDPALARLASDFCEAVSADQFSPKTLTV